MIQLVRMMRNTMIQEVDIVFNNPGITVSWKARLGQVSKVATSQQRNRPTSRVLAGLVCATFQTKDLRGIGFHLPSLEGWKGEAVASREEDIDDKE